MKKKEWWIPEEDDAQIGELQWNEEAMEETAFEAAEFFFTLPEAMAETMLFVGETKTETLETPAAYSFANGFEEFSEELMENSLEEREIISQTAAEPPEKILARTKKSSPAESAAMFLNEKEIVLKRPLFEENFWPEAVPIENAAENLCSTPVPEEKAPAVPLSFAAGAGDIDYEHLTGLVYDRMLQRLRAELSGSGFVTG